MALGFIKHVCLDCHAQSPRPVHERCVTYNSIPSKLVIWFWIKWISIVKMSFRWHNIGDIWM